VPLAISFDDVATAAERLRGIAHRTPVFTSSTADAMTEAKLFFKCENLQRMGAFKFRGAYNALSRFDSDRRSRGVIAFSSGNHAQAIALAARLLEIPATIVMPGDAPAMKLAATRGYGAEVVLYDRYTENREEIGTRLATERGMTLIPPYDHPDVMAGQGTAALEFVEQVRSIDGGSLDIVIVPVGGGGLISGCATAVDGLLPGCRIVGVEPEAGNDVQLSLARGEIVHIDVPRTIADGAQTQQPGRHTFPVIQALVDEIATVTDEALIDTMRFLAERMKLVVEPTGCLGAAGALSGAVDIEGRRVGILLSGGNIDVASMARLVLDGPRSSDFGRKCPPRRTG
jgi:threonine dehydratase